MNKESKWEKHCLNLCGLIYYKNFHFTCRVVDLDGKIWYNDGKSMGRSSTIDGTLQSITEDSIWSRGEQSLVAAIYAQK